MIQLRRIVLILFVLSVIVFTSSAQSSWQFADSVQVSGDQIVADNLGYVYVTGGSQVSRFDQYGNLSGSFSKLTDGPVTCTDASDPLKILLFYKEYGRIRFLDHTMSVQGDEINLAPLGFMSASLACLSYNNAFWIYDPSGGQLVRFTHSLQQDQTSGNIAQLCGFEIQPDALTEVENTVYLKDRARGILIFDRYGAYIRCLPFFDISWFTVKGDLLVFRTGDELHSYDMRSKEETVTAMPLKGATGVAWTNGRLFALKKGSMSIFVQK